MTEVNGAKGSDGDDLGGRGLGGVAVLVAEEEWSLRVGGNYGGNNFDLFFSPLFFTLCFTISRNCEAQPTA